MPRVRHFVPLLVFACAVFVPIAGAQAGDLRVSVLDDAGHPDPVRDVPRTFRFEGTAAPGEALFVAGVSSYGDACSPTYAQQLVDGLGPPWKRYGGLTDAVLSDDASGYEARAVPAGPFSVDERLTFSQPEAMFFCMWLGTSTTDTSPPTKQYVEFRDPTGTINVSMRGVRPVGGAIAVGVDTAATLTGSVETTSALIVSPRSGSTSCPAAWDDRDPDGIAQTFWVDAGAFSVTTDDWHELDPGFPGVVCAWLQSSEDEGSLVLGHAAYRYDIAPASPVRCTVPRVRGLTLVNARRAVVRAGCRLAPTRYVRIARLRRGTVTGTNIRTGARLLLRTPVAIVVSR
jgi:hypothetical protein